jgi:hypothetical protein
VVSAEGGETNAGGNARVSTAKMAIQTTMKKKAVRMTVAQIGMSAFFQR